MWLIMQRWEECYILLWSAPKKSSIGHRLSSSIFIMSTKRDGTVRSGEIQVTELVRRFVYAYEFCIMPVPGHYVKLKKETKMQVQNRFHQFLSKREPQMPMDLFWNETGKIETDELPCTRKSYPSRSSLFIDNKRSDLLMTFRALPIGLCWGMVNVCSR